MAALRVLVYGGKGALGSVCVNQFKNSNCRVVSIDLKKNEDAEHNIIVEGDALKDLETQATFSQELGNILGEEKLDAIICVAGGWAGGNAAAKAFIKNTSLMMNQSIWSSVISANLAAHHLKENGVLTLTGAQPALSGTPGMIGYGMAKAAVQHLTKSLGEKSGGLPEGSRVLTILPMTLDTPMNRKFMADADKSSWTQMEYVAELFHKWITEEQPTYPSGSLVKLVTENGKTHEELAS